MEAVCQFQREPWNKGKFVGQKTPFRLKDIWAIRVRLQIQERTREFALFNLGTVEAESAVATPSGRFRPSLCENA